MGTKNNPGKFGCYEDAAPDEPIFVLRAKDAMAPHVVRSWAGARQSQIEAGMRPTSDMEKVVEARQCAAQMELWLANQRRSEIETHERTALRAAAVDPRPPTPAPAPATAEPQPAPAPVAEAAKTI